MSYVIHKMLSISVVFAVSAGLPSSVQAAERATVPAPVELPAADKPSVFASPEYELRGFFGAGDDSEVSLRRIGDEKSQWYRLGKKAGGVLVEKADAKTGATVIVVNGTRMSLRLAGELHAGTTEKTTSTEKQDEAALLRNYLEWTGPQKDAAKLALKSSVNELLLNHPEYFQQTGSDTPEAKAAIHELLLKYTEAGNAVANADGTFPPKIENLSDKIEAAYGNLKIMSGAHSWFYAVYGANGKFTARSILTNPKDPGAGVAKGIAETIELGATQVSPDGNVPIK